MDSGVVPETTLERGVIGAPRVVRNPFLGRGLYRTGCGQPVAPDGRLRTTTLKPILSPLLLKAGHRGVASITVLNSSVTRSGSLSEGSLRQAL